MKGAIYIILFLTYIFKNVEKLPFLYIFCVIFKLFFQLFYRKTTAINSFKYKVCEKSTRKMSVVFVILFLEAT